MSQSRVCIFNIFFSRLFEIEVAKKWLCLATHCITFLSIFLRYFSASPCNISLHFLPIFLRSSLFCFWIVDVCTICASFAPRQCLLYMRVSLKNEIYCASLNICFRFCIYCLIAPYAINLLFLLKCWYRKNPHETEILWRLSVLFPSILCFVPMCLFERKP